MLRSTSSPLDGLLHPQGRGVYAFGYPRRDDLARAWRAVLMYPEAALSRTSSAWAHGLRNELGRVHLASRTQRRSTAVAVVHHVKDLPLLSEKRGSPALREALTLHRAAAEAPTRSELERRFRELIRGLPEPLWNVFVEGFWVDAYWPTQRVVVELDGGQHRTVSKQDSDTRRFAVLAAAGYIPLRFTWGQVTTDPAHVLRTVTAVL